MGFLSGKPKVLILGDESLKGHAATVQKSLADQAEVIFATTTGDDPYTSKSLLAQLDLLLGEEKWDLIYLTVGLNDLVYRAPGIVSFRVMHPNAGGVITVNLADFTDHLSEIVKQLTKRQVRFLWASIPPATSSIIGIREAGSEKRYNEAAAKIMKQAGVKIHDLHSETRALLKPNQQDRGVEVSAFQRLPIHESITEILAQELKLKR